MLEATFSNPHIRRPLLVPFHPGLEAAGRQPVVDLRSQNGKLARAAVNSVLQGLGAGQGIDTNSCQWQTAGKIMSAKLGLCSASTSQWRRLYTVNLIPQGKLPDPGSGASDCGWISPSPRQRAKRPTMWLWLGLT